MPQPQDARDGRFTHADPVTAAGFTMIPNLVMFRQDLTAGARLVYGYMSYLAWRNHGDEVEPPLETIADDLGFDPKTVAKYVRELRDSSLVVARRRGLGRTNVYVIQAPGSGDSRTGEMPEQERAEGPIPPYLPRETNIEKDPPSPQGDGLESPPPIVLVNGRNQPLDALCRGTGILDNSPRVKQAVTAMNGRSGRPGIRRLFWQECLAVAQGHGVGGWEKLAELHADPGRFSELLAHRVEVKIQKIRTLHPWRTAIPPSLVEDLWLDIEVTPRPGGGLTPEEIEEL